MSNFNLDELHHAWTTFLTGRDWALLDSLVPMVKAICPALLFVPDALGASLLERSIERGPVKALECLSLLHAERSHAPAGEFQAMLDGALFAAARSSDDADLAYALCKAGASVDSASPSNGRPALHDAMARGNFVFAEALLAMGAPDDAADVDGMLPADHLGFGMADFSRGSRLAKPRPPMVDAMLRGWLSDNNFSQPATAAGAATPPPLPHQEPASALHDDDAIAPSAVLVSHDLFARLASHRGGKIGPPPSSSDAPKP